MSVIAAKFFGTRRKIFCSDWKTGFRSCLPKNAIYHNKLRELKHKILARFESSTNPNKQTRQLRELCVIFPPSISTLVFVQWFLVRNFPYLK